MTSPQDPYAPQDPPRDPMQPPAAVPPGWYPPPPPQPRTSPWLWVALAAVTVLGTAGLVVGAVLFVGFTSSEEDFGTELAPSDEDYYVTQARVLDAVAAPCADLEQTAADLRYFSSVDEGRVVLTAMAEDSRAIATAIDGARPQEAAREMSTDWDALATALDDYATELGRDPEATFVMPEVDGAYVSTRIYWGNDECYVPTPILSLDPEATNLY